MRNRILLSIALIVSLGVLACNSNETLISQSPRPETQATPATPPSDGARRITAEELHKLFTANEVVIIDTRPESAYKQEHIKGAISVPVGTLATKFDQLPKGKMIAAYCTCPNEHTAAGAVLELKAKGYDNAAALLGGLSAWQAAGYPVEKSL